MKGAVEVKKERRAEQRGPGHGLPPPACSRETYQRRQPEASVLYRSLEAHLDRFLAAISGEPPHPGERARLSEDSFRR